METITKSFHFQKPSLAIPVTLEQIAAGLRGLSKAEFETLEILADREAAKILPESMRQASKGKIKNFLCNEQLSRISHFRRGAIM